VQYAQLVFVYTREMMGKSVFFPRKKPKNPIKSQLLLFKKEKSCNSLQRGYKSWKNGYNL